MTKSWSAEFVVSADLARDLIAVQFPQLAPVQVTALGVGWDNTAFRVNDVYVFRFPRRQFAVPFLEAECRLMPALAPRLPLPVPSPTFFGTPSAAFPWLFVGYPMLPGRTACTAALSDDQRSALAVPLAHFLRALHAIPAAEAACHGAQHDAIARIDIARRLPRARELLANLGKRRLIADPHSFSAILDTLPTHYIPRTDILVHGDLYTRHLLVDACGRLAGVIDWGDVHLGDPALDLMIAHVFLPPAGRALFRATYGQVDEVAWRLARVRGVWHTLTVLAYADDTGDTDLWREGQVALRHLGMS